MTTTHPEEALLLAAVLDQPDEDTVRLAYADWLDEHGQPERAEFIRLQIALEPHPECRDEYHCALANCDQPEHLQGWCADCAPVAAMRAREFDFMRTRNFGYEWAVAGNADFGWNYDGRQRWTMRDSLSPSPVTSYFRRGFVSQIRLMPPHFEEHGAAILAQRPIEQIHLPDFRVEIDPPGKGHGWQIYYYDLDLGDCIASSLGLATRADMVARLMADVRDLVAEFA